MNALGIDVCRTDGQVDWRIAAEHGVVFAGLRASISWGYRDGWLARNLEETRINAIHPLPYHVLYPGESAERQADNFLAATGDCWDIAYPVLDSELDHSFIPQVVTACMLVWLDKVQSVTGKHPIIYSRADWINCHTLPGEWRKKYSWWLAAYLNDRTIERPAPPALPIGVSTWLIHQNADKYAPWPGLMESNELDVNRWNGDKSAVDAYFSGVTLPQKSFLPAIYEWACNLPGHPYTGPGPE